MTPPDSTPSPAPQATPTPIWHNPDNLPSPGEPPWRFTTEYEKPEAGDEWWSISYEGKWILIDETDPSDPLGEITYRTTRPLPSLTQNQEVEKPAAESAGANANELGSCAGASPAFPAPSTQTEKEVKSCVPSQPRNAGARENTSENISLAVTSPLSASNAEESVPPALAPQGETPKTDSAARFLDTREEVLDFARRLELARNVALAERDEARKELDTHMRIQDLLGAEFEGADDAEACVTALRADRDALRKVLERIRIRAEGNERPLYLEGMVLLEDFITAALAATEKGNGR